ncbi:peptidoglycan-recognition protein LE-like isoform X1 [Cloeon dipterum]|uniref:peptidoglycan-recognition protein LE-like isoform X1 n=1 Tax=Cloeon dipterum TaxID=197152 RepID=UPI0032208D84
MSEDDDTPSAVAPDKEDSSDESEDEDKQQVTIQMPPTNFSNVSVQNSNNVHFGNTAVYNGDVTVIMSPLELTNMDTSLQQLKLSGEKLVLLPNGQPANLTDDHKTKLVERVLGKVQQCPDQTVHTSDKNAFRPKICLKYSIKRQLAVFSVSVVVISLLVSLIVILNLQHSFQHTCEDNNDQIECPIYDKGSNFINGTEGSAPYYSRVDWIAQPVNYSDYLKLPVEFVIISHSATQPCYNNSQCILQVRKFQMYHIESFGWADIAYNFLVGGEGGIYEGRGWDKIGAHAKGYNTKSIGVNVIGTFVNVLPTSRQMKSVKILMEEGVRLGKLREDYKLIGHRQVSVTESPGKTFFSELQKWPHWYSTIDLPKRS